MILWILWKRKRQRYGVTCKWSDETVSMKWRYGYAKYATMGALTGGLLVYGFQLGLLATAVSAVVGALFGAALWDWRRRKP